MSEESKTLPQYKCNICSKAFKSSISALQHEYIDLERYKCKTCGKCCATSTNLKIHESIHSNRRRKCYKCHLCVSKYYQQGHLDTHLQKFHPVEYSTKYKNSTPDAATFMKQYKCNGCDKFFRTYHGALGHMKIHLQQFQCPRCEKCFRSLSHLNRHQQFHIGRKYKCDRCKCMFQTEKQFDNHKKKCTERYRQFNCSVCPKEFGHRDSLASHMILHLERYKCSICDKSFARPYKLVDHMKMHASSGKPFFNYQCSQCLRFFRLLDALKIHKQECENVQQYLIRKSNSAENSGEEVSVRNVVAVDSDLFSTHSTVSPMQRDASDSDSDEYPLSTFLRKNEREQTETEEIKKKTNLSKQKCIEFMPLEVNNWDRVSITCNFCNKVCENKDSLKQHCFDKHLGSFRAFSCLTCQYSSSNRRHVSAHCRKEHGNAKLFRQNTPNEEEKQQLFHIIHSLSDKNIVTDLSSFKTDN